MLTPEQLEKIPVKAVKVWREFDEWLMNDICEKIAKAGKCTTQAEYQILVANLIGKDKKRIENELKRRLKLTKSEVDALFKDALSQSYLQELELYKKAGIDLEELQYLDQLIKVMAEQTNDYFSNMTNTLGYVLDGNPYELTDAYLHEMDLAYMKVSTGATTYNEAMQQSISKLVASGVRVIDYASGVHNLVDVAARRNIITSINQSACKVAEHNVEATGVEYVEITAHTDARPDHALWQGKVIKYKDLVKVTGYGSAAGLAGVNCRHSFYPYWPGISKPNPKVPTPTKTIDGKEYTPYDISQKKRYYERQIRRNKLGEIGANQSGDANLKHKYTELKRQSIKKYNDFCKKAGQRPETERTSVKSYK